MPKCIYCLEDKPLNAYKKREHVMPQCFGKFIPNNLILRETVCDDCNQYFGEKIELYLGRDTIEGLYRYRHGIKPRKLPKNHSRIKNKIAEGKLKGMIVLMRPSNIKGESDMDPVLQVGFLKKDTNEINYFEPDDIPTAKQLEEKGYILKRLKIVLICRTDDEEALLAKLLKEKGITYNNTEGEMAWPEDVKERKNILVDGIATIDPIIYRAFSKIVFNYLVYNEKGSFILEKDFDGIRRFIRYGEGASNDYFGVNEPPILNDDKKLKALNAKVTNGHLVIVEWQGHGIIGKLSIFNMSTYLIKLCKNHRGVWRPLAYGHHFDIETREVSRLSSVSTRLLP